MAGKRRPTDAQFRWLDTIPCAAERLPRPTAEALLARGWVEVEDVYRYAPATADRPEPVHRLVRSTFVLTGDGRAALESERQRRLEQIGLESEESETTR
jgi:hypothetical protein